MKLSTTPRGRALRTVQLLLAGSAVLLGWLWVRSVLEARLELSHAVSFERAGQPARAHEAHARAVRWAAPFNPYAERALDALLADAERLERAGERRRARALYRAARGSVIAAGGMWQPHAAALSRIEASLARLSASEPAERLAAPAAASRRAGSASVAGRVLALAGFAAFVWSAFWLAAAGFARDGSPRPRVVWGSSVGIALGFGCFCLGLWSA